MVRYSLSRDGVFQTVQGEGAYLGMPMTFIRLAGCSVGCAGCDTNYAHHEDVPLPDLIQRALEVTRADSRWAFITGGEPTDQDLKPLVRELRRAGFLIALVTSGIREVDRNEYYGGIDFLSVSPHSIFDLRQWRGDQVNIVPRLNGLKLKDVEQCRRKFEDGFKWRYVTPFDGDDSSLDDCLAFVYRNNLWQLGVQAHKQWGIA